MIHYLKLFKQSIILKLSREMAYKWNFIIKSIGIVTWNLVGPLIILLIYANSSGVPGWSLMQFFILIGTLEVAAGFAWFLFIEFPFDIVEAVREGEFDLYLLKPYNPLVFLSLTGIDIDAFVKFLVGAILVIFAAVKLNLSFFSLNTLAYFYLIFLAIAFLHAMMVIVSAVAIIAVKSYALLDVFFKLFDIVRYPVTIYSSEIQFFLTFLFPIAIVSFYPAQALMHGINLLTLTKITIAIASFYTVTIFIWKFALKKYSSAGG